jgi:hypothetical protein
MENKDLDSLSKRPENHKARVNLALASDRLRKQEEYQAYLEQASQKPCKMQPFYPLQLKLF